MDFSVKSHQKVVLHCFPFLFLQNHVLTFFTLDFTFRRRKTPRKKGFTHVALLALFVKMVFLLT